MAGNVGRGGPLGKSSNRVSAPPRETLKGTTTGFLARASVLDVLRKAGANCKVTLPNGARVTLGEHPPEFEVRFRTERSLRLPATEWAWGNAYISGAIDVEGDMRKVVDLRTYLRPGTPIGASLRFSWDLLMRSPLAVNKAAINRHYTLGDDFYLTFIDSRYRFYSHCVFDSQNESLEDAAEHKLEQMWKALDLRPGMRLLDIGGGWGGVAEYCSARGVHVTSVTLVGDSARYINALISAKRLTADVVLSEFLEFTTDQPFDHAVIYGVIEHIPNYARFSSKVWEVLKPGGRLYMDASATKEKYAVSPVTRAYTWPGHHAFLGLQHMIQELLFHGFEIIEVRRETRDYELTITHWAERFECSRPFIVEKWGEEVYRAFRIFLWGGAHAFSTNRLQAYHLVAERRPDQGPRPTLVRRLAGLGATLFER